MRTSRICFNSGWRFCAGDAPAAQTAEYDDSRWTAVTLPHDWSIAQPFDPTLPHGDQHAYLPNGTVTYRKHAEFFPAEGERVVLEFDGAYRNTDVFLNGRHLHQQLHGYLGFAVDLTPALTPGRNVIAVRVDNSREQTSRWYTGTGINRNVWLHHLPPRHFLRHGLRIVPAVDGTVGITAQTSLPGAVALTLVDALGRELAQGTVLAGEEATLTIPAPARWSPDSPALYRCRARLLREDGTVADEAEERFGFRSVEFCPRHGLIFNGEKLLLRGVNLHEDLCGTGTAVRADGIRRRYKILKQWGVNAVRLAHHPFAPEWYELADEMGLLVFAEAYDKWNAQYYGGQIDFHAAWPQDLAAFVNSRRNHPAIFLWSVGNEVVDQQLHGEQEFGVRLMRRMREQMHTLDPTRAVTCALYPARDGGVLWSDPRYRTGELAAMAREMDVVSVNYMAEFLTADHRKHPALVFLVSEENTSEGGGRWRLFDKEIGCGCFFWGGFDYLGEAKWPYKHWHRGLVDRSGVCKPIAYHAQALWSEEPVARIAVASGAAADSVEWNDVRLDWEELVSHWNWEPGELRKVVLFSNCERLELRRNDRLLLERELSAEDHCRVCLPVEFAPGELKLTGFRQGQVAAEHRLHTAGPLHQIRLQAQGYHPRPGGLLFVEITARDAGGTLHPSSSAVVHLQVCGPGTLLGVVNGDPQSGQSFASDALLLHQGRGLAVVRRDAEHPLTITATCRTAGGILHAEATA